MNVSATTKDGPVEQLDVVILGAGFAGLCQLHKLRNDKGLSVRVFDKAGGVGGTWYWNRYPGARSDTESFVYSYSFDPRLYDEWEWSDRYPRQPEILSYLEHVADRYDLRRSIRFSTSVTQAWFNDATNRWDIETDTGERVSAKWLVTGLGLLSAPNIPKFKGMETFTGDTYHTSRWPHHEIDFADKRVGVIGTGSTGVQLITELGPRSKSLTVFQRRPQYSVPARHGPMPKHEVAAIRNDLAGYFDSVLRSGTCFGFTESAVPAMSVSAEERERVFEENWQKGGGFRFMFGTFADIGISEASNEEAAKFVRGKIAQIVKDPEKARKLTPYTLYARRPLCDAGYFETFNLPTVDVIDIAEDPMAEITPKGIRLKSGAEVELDVIIFATGFDSVTGNFSRIDFRGRGVQKLKDHWAHGPRAHFGMCPAGFANMFTIYGPPGPFTNQPPAIEWQCEWVANTIVAVDGMGAATFEATPDAEQQWLDDCIAIADGTLFTKIDWWAMGTEIPGKPRAVMFFMGGMGAYVQRLEEATAAGYAGFVISKARETVDA